MKLIAFFKKHAYRFFLIFVFAVSIATVVYVLPTNAKFKYEYSKGSPWMHENLVAPYNFPVYKPAAVLQQERDSVAKYTPPYFSLDSRVAQLNVQAFVVEFDSVLSAFPPTVPADSIYMTGTLRQKAADIVQDVYSLGIMENLPETEMAETEMLFVLRGNLAVAVDVNNLYTAKIAYQTISDSIEAFMRHTQISTDSINRFVKILGVEAFVHENLIYDKITSKRVRSVAINNISLSRGMVQAGEGIILRGEPVAEASYQKLESLRREYEKTSGNPLELAANYIGKFLLVFALHLVLFIFLQNYRRRTLYDKSRILFILLLTDIMIVAAALTIKFNILNLYILPFALVPIIIKIFLDSRLAFVVHLVTTMLIGFMAPNGYEFVLVQFVASLVVLLRFENLHRRNQLFASAAIVVAAYAVTYLGLSAIHERNILEIEWINFAWFAASGFMLLTAFPLIYLIEKTFGFLSDITLLELSDANQPLLRLLAETAPGTFQHSMQVANLAESVVQRIGGNPLLTRTGALYHDIGKMEAPHYFTENQISGINPHDELDCQQSAAIIIGHVTNGVSRAKKANLPEQIIDFIRTHHGTSTTRYFLTTFQNKYPNKPVDYSLYTYPGPKPFSKETAIVMMSDAVEAASRSLPSYTQETINKLVEGIIGGQFNDGQFDDAPITLRDMSVAKDVLKSKLYNIYHTRIQYPKRK